MTTSTLRMLPVVLISDICHQSVFYLDKDNSISNIFICFLAVQTESVDSSIGSIVTHWLSDSLTESILQTFFPGKEMDDIFKSDRSSMTFKHCTKQLLSMQHCDKHNLTCVVLSTLWQASCYLVMSFKLPGDELVGEDRSSPSALLQYFRLQLFHWLLMRMMTKIMTKTIMMMMVMTKMNTQMVKMMMMMTKMMMMAKSKKKGHLCETKRHCKLHHRKHILLWNIGQVT